jgi:hypothetical protein
MMQLRHGLLAALLVTAAILVQYSHTALYTSSSLNVTKKPIEPPTGESNSNITTFTAVDNVIKQQDEISQFLWHSKHLEHVPLLHWEMSSVVGPDRTCSPPQNTPTYCCLGSTSSGGDIEYWPQKCLNNPENMVGSMI